VDIALADLFRIAGVGQLGILLASVQVPTKLNWKRDLAVLNHLHRQMYWTYGAYVVLGIVFLGFVSLLCADELASGSRLGVVVNAYGFVFWGARVALQWVYDIKPFLVARWMRAGYHVLTVAFVSLTVLYGVALVRALS
jgi:hypothetical protein